MREFFTIIFYQPLWNALVFLYNLIPGQDIGLAIILLTVVLKLLLLPFSRQALVAQKAMQTLQPKLAALKEKFKDNREQLAKETMALYAAEKVSPLSSCLPLLIQLPILIALYQVLRAGLGTASPELLYPFIKNPGILDPHFLGIMNLAHPNYALAMAAGLAQFVQSKMMQVKAPPSAVAASPGGRDESMLSTINKQMLYVMPVMTVFIGASLPGGLTLYWLVTNLLTVLQQYFFLRGNKKETVFSSLKKNS
ncbi:membrane protein insertase YidC [Candidatus Uhrbacteria bacterium]|nr:membrane protein insertase YidC [Candidatus Uhrbacteria bacterium]